MFLLLGWAVGRGVFDETDVAVSRVFAGWRPDWFVGLMAVISWLGYVRGGGLVALAAAVSLSVLRRRREDIFLLLTLAIIFLTDFFKNVYDRARPPASLIGFEPVAASGPSYPSGHAAFSAAVYGFLLLLIIFLVKSRAWRFALSLLATTMILAVAFSRVYLGAHFVTDVAGGLFFGAAWALLLGAFYRGGRNRSEVG